MVAAVKKIAGLLIGAVILFTLFFLGGPDYTAPRSIQYGWNSGHIIFFAIFTWLLLHFSGGLARKAFIFQCLFISTITLLFGLLIELFQYGLNRMPDIRDLLRNLAGALLILFFFSPSRKLVSKAGLRCVQLLLLFFLVADIFPLATLLQDEWQANKKFPILADFDSRTEVSRWSGTAGFAIAMDRTNPANHLLRVTFGTQPYSGIFLRYFPHDWRGYSRLTWKIHNPSPAVLHITCRIHDLEHEKNGQHYDDRFNRSFAILPGSNEISISMEDIVTAPASRKIDPGNIRAVGFFTSGLPYQQTAFLDDLQLSR